MTEPHFPKKSAFLPRLLLIVGVSVVLFFEAWCGLKVHDLSAKQKHYKLDYAFVNNVSYGLLSVDVWREQVVSAANDEIREYRLSPEQQKELRTEVNQLLNILVAHAFDIINRPQTSIGGKLKKLAVKTFVNEKKIRAQVPVYTDKLMAEVTKPGTFREIAKLADTALSQMGRHAYDSSVAATKHVMDSIYSRYHVADRPSFEKSITSGLAEIHKETYQYAFGMLACIIVMLLLWLVFRKSKKLHVALYMLSVVSAMILLVVGLTTTMIEIDARVAKMDLHFLGKEISFRDQGLFFQSKSIIDVVMLLLETKKLDSQIVGVLILIFSVVFPFMKLAATGISLVSEDKWAKNKFIHYFAFNSGKWSMADVMVVAILMTYIGFNGIVHNTLSGLAADSKVTTISTNYTSVQPGYIIFIAFVIYGFVLSSILKKISKGFTVQ